MKFCDMPYERVDLDALGAEFDKLTEAVRNAKSGAEVLEAFRAQEKLSVHAQTMISIASVRNSIDTRDEFYEAEREFYDTNLPAFEEHSQNLMLAVFESPYRTEVEKVTGELMFKNLEMD
ncbi:MAG: M3 family oligoendopeptidase, partial [Ruminococcaceae bacterium]|nr:M3 family oligoendopeptidase [Oscillospiraceae bacterium]